MGKSYKKNYLFSLLNTLSGLLFPLISFPYVARILMPSGIGEVNFYLSIINYISMFTSIGIPTYAIIEIAKTRDDIGRCSITTIEILILNALLSLVGYIIIGILCISVPQIETNIPLFLLMSLNILLVTIGCEWFYQGTENFEYITIRGVIIRIICLVLLFILVKDSSDLIYYGLYSVLGVAGNNILNFIYLRKNIDITTIKWSELNISRHLSPALKIFGVNVIASIYLQLDTVMLGFLKNNTTVGYYTGAIRITKMIMGLITSLGVVFLPRLSSSIKTNYFSDTLILIRKTIDFIIFLSLPIAVGLFMMSSILIRLFCGYNYAPAIETLQILSPIIIFIGISYIFAQCMLAMDKINITLIVGSICATINVISNFIFIPRYAQDGAAMGTFFAELASMICYMLISKKIFDSYIILSRHLIQCVISVSVMGCIIYLLLKLPLEDIYQLFLLPIVGALSYTIMLFLTNNKMFKEYLYLAVNKIRLFPK